MLSFFPRGVLDEFLNLIESASEGFLPTLVILYDLMTLSANGIQKEIKVKGQKLGTVTSFKYLGAVVSDDGSKPEVLLRIAQATAALTKLKPIWRDNNISLGSKVKLMRSLVISIFLYACESWTLTAEL